MNKPTLEQFGITKEQFDHIESRNDKIIRILFGTCILISALAGVIYAFSEANGISEIILGIIFFGFIGLSSGVIIAFVVVGLYFLLLKVFSPLQRFSFD